MYNPLFVFLQSQKWYTFGLQFGIFMRYYLQHLQATVSCKDKQIEEKGDANFSKRE